MQTKELRKLALLGVTAGIMTVSQSGLNASEDATALDVEQMIARPKCNDSSSCGELTVLRNSKNHETSATTSSHGDLEAEEEPVKEGEERGYGA